MMMEELRGKQDNEINFVVNIAKYHTVGQLSAIHSALSSEG